ncbi:pyridoxal phosphate-dependent aminotransferase [Tropicibacter oceani]|uniref:histidinol-phosphate transaminase n=1 Tax=Tropicibacter oceani TaxID=3058420 RepID=A0ABY8QIA8_9RHOB|nr:pyridoxal phosphate-dependent aminotransferase [Tropicibacter oceani]WGW03713.1 pyridoxal phosphate-dependent aminotransferase [Tropicibacter oceani]
MTGPRYPALIKSLPSTVPFVGPEVQERQRGAPFRARLGANENIFGPSPFAVAAMQDEAADIWKYADPTHHELMAALAAHMGCGPGHIVIGEGIDTLLGYTVRLLVEPGDAVVTSDGAYPTFNFHVAGYGGVLHKVPFKDDKEDLEALMAKAAEVDAKLVYLSNPDNPMGTWHSGAAIKDALELLPEGTLLVLDEAYIEFAPHGTAPQIAADDPRVVRFRTFSKAYGMAGARVAYAVGARDLITAYDKIRNHFAMNRLAQTGALAALQDSEWLEQVLRLVEDAKQEITRIAGDCGLRTLPSATNFVAINCGRDGDFARSVLAALIADGVFVRMPFVAPQDRCIRVSAGRPEDLKILAEALPKALASAKSG